MDVLREGDWEAQAACQGFDTNVFFPEKAEVPGEIKRLCKDCLVKTECREAAMREERGAKKRYGYRGGLSGAERTALYRHELYLKRTAEDGKRRRPDSESTYS